jgi:hypothetical protein
MPYALIFFQLTDGCDAAMGDTGEIKLVLVVNNELKMGKGKIAAQVIPKLLSSFEIPNNLYSFFLSLTYKLLTTKHDI